MAAQIERKLAIAAVLSSEELPPAAIVENDPLGLLVVEAGRDEVIKGAGVGMSGFSMASSARTRIVCDCISRVLIALGRDAFGVKVVFGGP